ncbi:hypothetical protein AB0I81_62775 [Nonomuraea sp. NPDC050404]|uniref:hypothetical protein n=1 Tax=Nonomuraea sp. NPDC050404 TaxID=3155783 RepID=UPI0033F8C4BE
MRLLDGLGMGPAPHNITLPLEHDLDGELSGRLAVPRAPPLAAAFVGPARNRRTSSEVE